MEQSSWKGWCVIAWNETQQLVENFISIPGRLSGRTPEVLSINKENFAIFGIVV